MSGSITLAILSDIHYAGAGEQERGDDFEFRNLRNPMLRGALRAYRNLIWMRHPLRQNLQLDRFLAEVSNVDYVVVNGDYT